MNTPGTSLEKYTKQFLASTIDQSVLKPTHTAKDIEEGARICTAKNLRALVVNPCYVMLAKQLLSKSQTLVASVCDFPHGRDTTANRVNSVKGLLQEGVDEVDIVAKYHLLKDKDHKGFKEDIRSIIQAINGKVLKIILEVDHLTGDEIKEATRLIAETVKEEKAINIIVKTKTGFALENKVPNLLALSIIKTILEGMGIYAKKIDNIKKGKIGIKTSGGIKTKEDALPLLDNGAHILGTSSGDEIAS